MKEKEAVIMTELETMQRAKMYLDKLARGIDPSQAGRSPATSWPVWATPV